MLQDHFVTREFGAWRQINLHSWLPCDAFKNLFIICNEGSVADASRFNANSYLPLVRYEYVVEAPTEDVMDFLLPVSVSG